eukprot:1798041-Amphidinium_carterae.1
MGQVPLFSEGRSAHGHSSMRPARLTLFARRHFCTCRQADETTSARSRLVCLLTRIMVTTLPLEGCDG